MPIAQSSSKSQADTFKSIKQQSKNIVTESDQKPEQNTNSGTRTPPEQPEFIKQTLIIIEKKVRNLDKRRIKLEEYKETQRKGYALNEDQLSAVSKYDEVLRTLELTREMEKQFVGLANDTMKQQKKQAKKEQMVQEEQFKEKLSNVHKYVSLMKSLVMETVRNDFLSEVNGAIKVTPQEFELLDEFQKLVNFERTPGTNFDAASVEFADHLSALIEGKNKPITQLTTSTTYAELKKLFDRIFYASYWTEELKQNEPSVSEEVEQNEISETNVEEQTVETLNKGVNDLQLNEQQKSAQTNEQASYQNNEDFVIVSSSECAESLCHSKSSSLEPQQKQQQLTEQQDMSQSQKTFFTTLNQPEQRNINEFINSCENNDEGLNFFQDSELQSRQQNQQQEQLNNLQQNEVNFLNQQQNQQQDNQFNQQSNDLQKDQQFKHRGHREQNGNRPYQNRDRRYPDDRRNNGPQQMQQRGDNRGPRNNGYRNGTNNSGPRNDTNGQRGGYRGDGGYRGQNGGMKNDNNNSRNTGNRGNYQQQHQRGNQNQEMHDQNSQMA